MNLAAAAPEAEACFAAVGVPGGVIVDPASSAANGAVRMGGQLRSLSPAEYSVWLTALSAMPMSMLSSVVPDSMIQAMPSTLSSLEERGLVVRIEPGQEMSSSLACLRALPIGVPVGNRRDPGVFEVRTSIRTEGPAVDLDMLEAMFWWQFDGATSLSHCAREVEKRLPTASESIVRILAARTVHRMMAHRLLYLDAVISER